MHFKYGLIGNSALENFCIMIVYDDVHLLGIPAERQRGRGN